jgi:hypothetical protein
MLAMPAIVAHRLRIVLADPSNLTKLPAQVQHDRLVFSYSSLSRNWIFLKLPYLLVVPQIPTLVLSN